MKKLARSLVKLVVVMTVLNAPAVADEALDEARVKLEGLRSYSFEIISKTYPRRLLDLPAEGVEPVQMMTSDLVARLPDKMALRATQKQDGVTILTTLLFDGTWQWTDVQHIGPREKERRVAKIEQAIARPGKPFDTFYYMTGTGLYGGEDYVGTFTEILGLYTFGPGREGSFEGRPCRLYDGTLDRKAFDAYLVARGQAGIEGVVPEFVTSMERVRLALDDKTGLPIGYTSGSSFERPGMVALFTSRSLNETIADSVFAYQPPAGYAVFDDTAKTARSRSAATSIPEGSSLFQVVARFLKADNPIPEDQQEMLSDGAWDKAETVLKAKPSTLTSTDYSGAQPLAYFAAAGSAPAAQRLLALGAPVEGQVGGGRTALHLAAQANRTDVVRMLLTAGANPNARDPVGYTPLHLSGDLEVFQVLVDAGADPTLLGNDGKTARALQGGRDIDPAQIIAFLEAIASEDSAAVKKFVDAGLNPTMDLFGYLQGANVRIRDFGATPLQYATSISEPALRTLWQAWPEPQLSDTRKVMATELLSKATDLATVRFLLAQGADLDQRNGDDLNLLYQASIPAARAMLQAGLKLRRGTATALGDFQAFYLSRDEDADQTALAGIMAVVLEQTGPEEIDAKHPTGFPIREGGVAFKGATLLHLAASQDENFWVDWLLQHGATPDMATEDGWTPLHLAVVAGQEAIVAKLLAKGVLLETAETGGWTPLHSAAYLGNPGITQLLLENKASISAKDKLGNTPLHAAASGGRLSSVKLLLARGASKTEKNADGETALDLAPTSQADLVKALQP